MSFNVVAGTFHANVVAAQLDSYSALHSLSMYALINWHVLDAMQNI